MEGTALAAWTRESPSIWAYPTILTLHTIGLGIVVGASVVVDLRLLGYARRIPSVDLAPLFPVMWWAFALNAADRRPALHGRRDDEVRSSRLLRQARRSSRLALVVDADGCGVAPGRSRRRSAACAAQQAVRAASLSLVFWAAAHRRGPADGVPVRM